MENSIQSILLQRTALHTRTHRIFKKKKKKSTIYIKLNNVNWKQYKRIKKK